MMLRIVFSLRHAQNARATNPDLRMRDSSSPCNKDLVAKSILRTATPPALDIRSASNKPSQSDDDVRPASVS
eukprot:CAMPEP_0115561092 /NCGR_PEP_ID=MMETSP0271-20121206/100806_1 /TAXON_ID=71861 /ORGANISM="Scrippsiella trochoidea, Strain CCMP3099" /LENGTH=71 /DNA_ID=CAMNT_0002995189 /DNA_START=696 /DNA_END=911 /DNA_ORIENTATION=-